MTPTQEKIMAAVTIMNNSPLVISYRTKLPWKICQIHLNRLANQDLIVRKEEPKGMDTYRKHNPYKSGQRNPA